MTAAFEKCAEICPAHNEPCTSHHIQGDEVHSHAQEGRVFRHVWKTFKAFKDTDGKWKVSK